MKKRIAIIGAGISRLTLAEHLKDYADVVVYEKARGVGGRMSVAAASWFQRLRWTSMNPALICSETPFYRSS